MSLVWVLAGCVYCACCLCVCAGADFLLLDCVLLSGFGFDLVSWVSVLLAVDFAVGYVFRLFSCLIVEIACFEFFVAGRLCWVVDWF